MSTPETGSDGRQEGERAKPRGLGASYWRFLGASVLSNLGDGLALIAIPWYASTLTDNALAIAAVGISLRLPWLFFAVVAGTAGDRMDRRGLMVIAGGTKVLLLASLSLFVLFDVRSIGLLLMVALLIGICEVFFDNTGQALLPNLVRKNQLERANGMLWGAEEASNRFVGAPAAGFLLLFSLVSPIATQAVLTAVALILLLSIRGDFRPRRAPGTAANASPGFRRMLVEGVLWLWRHPMLRSLAITLGVFNAAIALAMAVLVLFVQEVLDLGPEGFGLVMTASAIGAVVSSQISPWLAVRLPPGATLGGILGLQVFLYLGLLLVPSVPVFVLGSVTLGFNMVWWNIITVSLRQRIIPDHLLSRVNSVYRTLGWGTAPLGMLIGGGAVNAFEPLLGREMALRMPYLFAALLCAFLLIFLIRTLSTRKIREALSNAQNE